MAPRKALGRVPSLVPSALTPGISKRAPGFKLWRRASILLMISPAPLAAPAITLLFPLNSMPQTSPPAFSGGWSNHPSLRSGSSANQAQLVGSQYIEGKEPMRISWGARPAISRAVMGRKKSWAYLALNCPT